MLLKPKQAQAINGLGWLQDEVLRDRVMQVQELA